RDSVKAVITKAFYENFLTHFTAEGEGKDIQNQLTWLQRLPTLAVDKSDNALVLALEATATAYGAIMISNAALTWHARDLYGTALRVHHNVLQKSGSTFDITIHMVSTSVLLSFFEAMQATTADAYRAHIYGAAKLLEITGPGQCAHGVLCQLFYHVRTQILFVQLASDQHSVPFPAKKILYDTLLYKDPPLIQRLMCCIAALRELHAQTYDKEHLDQETYGCLNLEVNQLWDEFSRQKPTKNPNWQDTTAEIVLFNDAFTALTAAYFSSAHILLAILRPDTTDFPDLLHHSRMILDVAAFLDITHNAIAYMRMATPLLLVALHAQSFGHRNSVVGIFEIWSRESMRGISALALDAVHR
ncbi:hypothetical protein BU25DRAFT_306639, partial [Macroventuria anomochaeta]